MISQFKQSFLGGFQTILEPTEDNKREPWKSGSWLACDINTLQNTNLGIPDWWRAIFKCWTVESLRKFLGKKLKKCWDVAAPFVFCYHEKCLYWLQFLSFLEETLAMKMAADVTSPRIRNSEFQSHWWLYSGRGTIYKWEMIKRHTQKLEIHEKHFKIILLPTMSHSSDITGHVTRRDA